MIHLVVYDFNSYETKSVVERPIYFEYQPSYCDGGSFSVTAQKTTNNSNTIRKGDLIWIEEDIVGQISQIQVSETSETVVFKGTLCDDVLSSRYIFENLEYSDDAVNTVISDLFSNITAIPNLSLSISTRTLERPDISIGPGNFLDILKYVCEKFKVGYKVVKSPTTTGLQLVLKIYEGQDLSESVIMSRKYESLTNFEFTDVSSDEINFVRVLGENDIVVDVTSTEYTVQNRREYMLDCTGVEQGEMTQQEYQALLTSKGQEVIIAHKGQKTYKGDYTGLTFVLGQDYYLGDIVTLSGIGENSEQKVNSFLKQVDKTGEYIKIFFGQMQKTLTSQVHSTMKQVEKISEKADSQPASTGAGTGKFLDSGHTSVAHNDLDNNASQGMYDSVDGYDNVLTGTSTISETGYVSNGANTVTGQHNRVNNSSSLNVSGDRNTVNSSYSSVITGDDNIITNNAYCSFLAGNNIVTGSSGTRYSVVLGDGMTISNSADNSFLNGGSDACLSRIYQSVVVGGINGGYLDGEYIPAGEISYSLIASDNAIIQNQMTGSVMSGNHNRATNIRNSGIFGEYNEIYGSSDCGVFGVGHYVTYDSCVVCGEYGTTADSTRYYFVIGNGGSSSNRRNALTVDTSGNLQVTGTITPGGADYAETYEWIDGNPNDEDRRGLFVTCEGKYIRLAESSDDYILGVVSATPSICGDTYDLHWKGKYKKDIFGELLKDDDGNPILSPEYNPNLEYMPQSLRKEKSKVGTQGKLVVVDDGTCQPNKYCKPYVNGIGTYSDNPCYYRVLERLDESHVRIVIK